MILCSLDAPVLRTTSTDRVAAAIGTTAMMKCSVSAYPEANLLWMKEDGTLLNNNGSSTLYINQVSSKDYGTYTCKASNHLGELDVNITLQRLGRPGTPGTPYSIRSGSTWVLLGWRDGFNGGYNNLTYKILIHVHNNMKAMTTDCELKNPCNVTGLDSRQLYTFSVSPI